MGEPVKKTILYGGRFAGLNREYSKEYSGNILSARLEARREHGARARQSSSTSGARGMRVVVCAESSGGASGLPPSPMKLILAPVSSS